MLRDVNVGVQRGEAVGLLGPNGAGKTTCFYIITGLIAPDVGTISLDGQDITDLPMYRRARLGIGYLPQEASIFRGLTVEQNIRAVLEVAEPEPRRARRMHRRAARRVLDHPSAPRAGDGAFRRRAAARRDRARARDPAAFHPARRAAGRHRSDRRQRHPRPRRHLKDRGIGVLITDHNVRETLDIVDRAYILHEGRVLMEGTPPEIVADADVRRVYLGERFSL